MLWFLGTCLICERGQAGVSSGACSLESRAMMLVMTLSCLRYEQCVSSMLPRGRRAGERVATGGGMPSCAEAGSGRRRTLRMPR